MVRTAWCEHKAEFLKAMLEDSVQRRFPNGVKLRVHSLDRYGCLSGLAGVLKKVSFHG